MFWNFFLLLFKENPLRCCGLITYRKIPKISPGLIFFKGPLFEGKLPFLLCFALYLRAISKYKPPGGLLFGGAI